METVSKHFERVNQFSIKFRRHNLYDCSTLTEWSSLVSELIDENAASEYCTLTEFSEGRNYWIRIISFKQLYITDQFCLVELTNGLISSHNDPLTGLYTKRTNT